MSAFETARLQLGAGIVEDEAARCLLAVGSDSSYSSHSVVTVEPSGLATVSTAKNGDLYSCQASENSVRKISGSFVSGLDASGAEVAGLFAVTDGKGRLLETHHDRAKSSIDQLTKKEAYVDGEAIGADGFQIMKMDGKSQWTDCKDGTRQSSQLRYESPSFGKGTAFVVTRELPGVTFTDSAFVSDKTGYVGTVHSELVVDADGKKASLDVFAQKAGY